MSKVKDIYIDADHLVYEVAYSQSNTMKRKDYKGSFKGVKRTGKLDITRQKHHFKTLVADYRNIAEIECVAQGWKCGEIYVVLSDKTNFRYEVYPDYKSGRKQEHSDLFLAVRKWARKKYMVVKNTEADDVVSYYARKGHLVFTTDKDVFKGNEGYFYNCHHKHRVWVRTSKDEAQHFFKLQVLAGDPVDSIPALMGVGMVTAEKLLLKFEGDVEAIYKSKGQSRDYMVQMARLVAMDQWSPKKGIKLWQKW